MIAFKKSCCPFFFFFPSLSTENEHIILSGNVKMPNSCHSTLSANVEARLIRLPNF